MEIWGIILILFSGAGIAFSLLQGGSDAIACARATLELLCYVKNSVENHSMPASEILRNCDRDIFLRMGYPVSRGAPASFIELWENCNMADTVSRDLFFDFASGFGKSYRRQQVEECQLAARAVGERLAELEGAMPARRKMIISICISVSLILVILLL